VSENEFKVTDPLTSINAPEDIVMFDPKVSDPKLVDIEVLKVAPGAVMVLAPRKLI
jgi:hypothetical protein